MAKDKEFNSKGDRVNSRDDGGYTCRTDKDRGTCTNNRTGESVNVSRNNDNSWSIDTSNTGNRNTFGSNYPSHFRDDKDTGGGYSGNSGGGHSSGGEGNDSGKVINLGVNEKHNQLIFENSLDKTGVLNMQYASSNILNQMTHLINVRGTMENGWGPNVLMNLKVLNLSGSSLSGPELSPLFKSMYYQKMDLNLLDLSYNKMCDNSVGEMLWSIGNESGKQIHAIRCLKINNNQIGDKSAEYFNWHLSSGSLKYTKYIDVSGNNVTENGKGFIAKALQKIDHGISITIEKFNSSAKDFWQSSAKAMLFIAKNNGIETKDALTNQETIEHCKKGLPNVGKNIAVGLAKCNNIFVKYATPKDVTLQDIGTDIISIVFPQTVPALNAYCNTEKVFFSVVDDDFANCLEGLIGVDSNLNK